MFPHEVTPPDRSPHIRSLAPPQRTRTQVCTARHLASSLHPPPTEGGLAPASTGRADCSTDTATRPPVVGTHSVQGCLVLGRGRKCRGIRDHVPSQGECWSHLEGQGKPGKEESTPRLDAPPHRHPGRETLGQAASGQAPGTRQSGVATAGPSSAASCPQTGAL